MDVKKFNEDLKTAPWNVMDTFDTLGDKYEYQKFLSNSIAEKYMPTKKMRQTFHIKQQNGKSQAITLKGQYAGQYAHNRAEENWETKRKWRNEATKFRLRAIREYQKQKVDHLKSKPSNFQRRLNCFGLARSNWKKGEWYHVYKKDDQLDQKNYGPKTLLGTVDKVYEQLLSEQVNGHFNTVLDPSLSACRKNQSCEPTLLRLTEEWKMAKDFRQNAGVLSMDMSKAFASHHCL